ncbi:hypothetical protein DPMN_122432 [Dreissena polymorpha]|uniref:Uncharacterized protein n=1 Tax=Dreissena polymorpha TaxID=45954 RepID=A0A9D4JS01_DREPO|nr:hypothetical protein DPMN_122432 [Dreissena polymorpha]
MTPTTGQKLKKVKQASQRLCRSTHDKHIADMLSDNHENKNTFWNYIKSRRKDNCGVSP